MRFLKPDYARRRETVREEDLLTAEERAPIGIRAIIIGLVLVAFITYVSAKMQILPPRVSMGRSHFPWPPIFVLFGVILLVNAPLYLLRRSLCLRPAELVTVFCMTFVSVAIPTYGLMMHLCTRLGGLSYVAKAYRESKLAESCGPYFTPALEPSSSEAVRWFYEGLPAGKSVPWDIPWAAWAMPILMWFLLIGFIYLLYMCLAVVLSRQWIEYEKLPFAAAQVPLAVIGDDEHDPLLGRFLRNRAVWIGFAVPFLIHSYNCLASLSVDMPQIPIVVPNWDSTYLTEPPWSALRPMSVRIFPTAIAFIFLISKEVSFSLLFFYALQKVQVVIAYYLGYATSHRDFIGPISYFSGQAGGALAMLALMGLWVGRAHIREVFENAFPSKRGRWVFAGMVAGIAGLRLLEYAGVLGAWFTPQVSLLVTGIGALAVAACLRAGTADDSREILPYRVVAVGLPLSVYGVVRWCEIAGMSFWPALFIVAALIVIAIAMTRLVAEGGVLHLKANVDPVNFSYAAFGRGGLGPANMTVMSTLRWGLLFEMPAFLMPALMNAMKIGADRRCSGRRFGLALTLAICVAVALSFYVYISTSYELGAMRTWKYLYFTWTHHCWRGLANDIAKAEAAPGISPDWRIMSYAGLGAAVMFVFYMLRQRFLWFVHPLGYVAWISPYMMNSLWLPILIGWALKSLLTKFGGHAAYSRARPFFIGVIVGESIAIVIWSVLSWALNRYAGVRIRVQAFG